MSAIRAIHLQEGGSGTQVMAQDIPDTNCPEIQAALSAQITAETALEETQAELQAQIDHSKDLYKALCVERQKVSRTKAAKAHAEAIADEAQSSLELLEEQFEQADTKK